MADRIIKPDSGDQLVLQDEGGSDALVISTSGGITKPIQPAFLVTNSATQSDIPVGVATTVVFDTEIFDQGGDFSSNTFTAPITGRYQLSCMLRLGNIDTAATTYWTRFNCSNRSPIYLWSPGQFSSDVTWWSLTMAILVDMDAADTAKIQINQDGGSAQTDIQIADSFFSGYLVA
jgi:hypothetical protein